MIACPCAVCSSTDPRDKRTRSSVLVRTGGRTLLIDAGPDLRQQMLRERVEQLDAVLLTHEHMDHIAGMDDLRAFSFAQQPARAVPVFADAPTLEAVRRVYAYAFSGPAYPGLPQFELHAIDSKAPFDVKGVQVVPVEVMHHRLPVLAFRIGDLAYITDAKRIERAELEKLRGCRVLVVNALRKEEHISHLNLQEALELIEELAPERAFLTHISHLMGAHADVLLPQHVRLAHDGLRVEL